MSTKKKKKKKRFMLLYGKNSILERIRFAPHTIQQVLVQNNCELKTVLEKVYTAGIPLKEISQKELYKLKPVDDLQGVIARVVEFQYAEFEELLSVTPPLVLIFLDRIYDPHNLGSMIRSTACFGNAAIILPEHHACHVTDSVLHVASGGENFVPITIVPNLCNAIRLAKKSGYWIAGAMVDEGEDITKVTLPFPLGIVLGSEGKGIRAGVAKLLDMKIMIPTRGAQLSLNVSMACAILCYELSKQKGSKDGEKDS